MSPNKTASRSRRTGVFTSETKRDEFTVHVNGSRVIVVGGTRYAENAEGPYTRPDYSSRAERGATKAAEKAAGEKVWLSPNYGVASDGRAVFRFRKESYFTAVDA